MNLEVCMIITNITIIITIILLIMTISLKQIRIQEREVLIWVPMSGCRTFPLNTN